MNDKALEEKLRADATIGEQKATRSSSLTQGYIGPRYCPRVAAVSWTQKNTKKPM